MNENGNGNGRAAAGRIVWWIVGALFAVVTLLTSLGVMSIDRRVASLEQIALVRVPEHAKFEAQIDALMQRVIAIEQFRDGFREDIRGLTRELSALREQMAAFGTLLARESAKP